VSAAEHGQKIQGRQIQFLYINYFSSLVEIDAFFFIFITSFSLEKNMNFLLFII